jgi:hypothetical protein
MRSRGGDQLAALRTLLGAAAEDTVPTLPKRLLEGADARLNSAARCSSSATVAAATRRAT